MNNVVIALKHFKTKEGYIKTPKKLYQINI